MAQISRDVGTSAAQAHEVIVIGGGIHGLTLAMELATRGVGTVLLERDDFTSGTTANWLRIVHGGLRYLQSIDLPRYFESVAARSAWLRGFPQLVEPLPCLLPLYGKGMKRNSVLRAALGVNALLSRHRNDGLQKSRCLAAGGVLSAAEALQICPALRQEGMTGAALWYDAIAPDANRLALAVAHRAACSAALLNHVEVTGLLLNGHKLAGVRALDKVSGSNVEFRAPVVINAAGQWGATVAQRCGVEVPGDAWTLAWNLVLDRPPIADHALAVTPPGGGGQAFFVVPCRDRLLAGTGHAPAPGGPEDRAPSEEQIALFLQRLNAALPGLNAAPRDVLRVFSGLQPATAAGASTMASRSRLVDHCSMGGPRGLYTLVGIKYTTARTIAEWLARRLFGKLTRGPDLAADAREAPAIALLPPDKLLERATRDPAALARELTVLAREEAAVYLDDLLLRRTQLADAPQTALQVAELIGSMLGLPDNGALKRIEAAAAQIRSS